MPRNSQNIAYFALLLLIFMGGNSGAQTITATQNGKIITTEISAAPALAIAPAQVPRYD
jgi:hypothetical protein